MPGLFPVRLAALGLQRGHAAKLADNYSETGGGLISITTVANLIRIDRNSRWLVTCPVTPYRSARAFRESRYVHPATVVVRAQSEIPKNVFLITYIPTPLIVLAYLRPESGVTGHGLFVTRKFVNAIKLVRHPTMRTLWRNGGNSVAGLWQ